DVGDEAAGVGDHREGGDFAFGIDGEAGLIKGVTVVPQRVVHPDLQRPGGAVRVQFDVAFEALGHVGAGVQRADEVHQRDGKVHRVVAAAQLEEHAFAADGEGQRVALHAVEQDVAVLLALHVLGGDHAGRVFRRFL